MKFAKHFFDCFILFSFVSLSPGIAWSDSLLSDSSGKPLLELQVSGDKQSGKAFFQGVETQFRSSGTGEKRSYHAGNGDYVVKSSDDGFKLKRNSGELIWKLKRKENKVKLSDNEENEHPFEMKLKSSSKITLEKDDVELGSVRYDLSSKQLEVLTSTGETIYSGSAARLSAAFALLLLKQIPLEERTVLFVEMLAHNL